MTEKPNGGGGNQASAGMAGSLAGAPTQAEGGATAGGGEAGTSSSGGATGVMTGGSRASDAGVTDAAPPPADDPAVGNAFVAVGSSSRRVLSTDGKTWGNTATSDGPFENLLQGVAFGDGAVVAVGMAGIFRSVDGKAWDHVSTNNMTSVAYHDGVFLAFLDDAVHRSTDGGKTWTRKSGTGTAIHWRTAYGNGHWIAVGDKNASIGVRKVSEDGLTWHDYSDQVGFRLNSVAYGAGRFIAIGEGGNGVTTVDGKTWERTDNVGLGDFPIIAFGDGKFVACAGRCRVSTDGKTWSAAGPSPGPTAHAFGNGQWVGAGSEYYTSTDGLRWTAHGSGSGGLDQVSFGKLDGL
jgi:hypothetical protein